MSDIIIYENGNVKLKATVEKDSIWLSQKQIAEIFEVQRSAITKHLSNIFKSNELDEKVVCSILEHTTKHGAIENKKQTRKTKYYNLDAILSIGYRVNSKKATQFRIWATSVLKEYVIKGYVLNKDKLQQQKLRELDQTIQLIKQGLQNRELSGTEVKGFVSSDDEIKVMNGQTVPFMKKMENNSKQIKILENTRDTLLPKLMSGEMRVVM